MLSLICFILDYTVPDIVKEWEWMEGWTGKQKKSHADQIQVWIKVWTAKQSTETDLTVVVFLFVSQQAENLES